MGFWSIFGQTHVEFTTDLIFQEESTWFYMILYLDFGADFPGNLTVWQTWSENSQTSFTKMRWFVCFSTSSKDPRNLNWKGTSTGDRRRPQCFPIFSHQWMKKMRGRPPIGKWLWMVYCTNQFPMLISARWPSSRDELFWNPNSEIYRLYAVNMCQIKGICSVFSVQYIYIYYKDKCMYGHMYHQSTLNACLNV